MRIELRTPPPITLSIGDREYTLRASLGAIRRTELVHGVKADQLSGTNIVPLLYECIIDRPPDLTLERFADELPLDTEGLEQLVAHLLPPSNRPPGAAR
jgi:hypothetical protein